MLRASIEIAERYIRLPLCSNTENAKVGKILGRQYVQSVER